MDTSKEYIEMCEKAEEIQKEWKPMVGDYLFRKYTIFGDLIDEKIWGDKTTEINILTYKSSVQNFHHAVTVNGETRLFNSAYDLTKETCIWILRQDQLQELVKDRMWGNWDLSKFLTLDPFYDFWKTEFIEKHNHYNSMEQLWLAFVMKEKFNKTWTNDKKEWIEIST